MRRITRVVVSIIPALMAVLAGVEVAVRFDDWSRYGTPLLSDATDIADLAVRDADGLHARAGASFKYFRIDSLGFRGPNRSREELATAPVIVTSGASETFGLYESEGMEWPRRLEAHLASAPTSGSARVPVVLNAAFAGMSLPTVSQDIRRRLVRLRPDFVVYYPTPAQYLYPRLPIAAQPLTTGAMERVRLPRARARQRMRDAFKGAVPEAALDILRGLQTSRARGQLEATGVFRFDAEAATRLDQFEHDLRALVTDIQAIGAEPVLVVHAHRFRDTLSLNARQQLRAWAKFYPMVSGRELLVFDSLAAERTVRVARAMNIRLVNPLASLRAMGDDAWADHTHFSDGGAEAVAREVSKVLLSRPAAVTDSPGPPR